jgi:predicted protein tyrosine phosphatase
MNLGYDTYDYEMLFGPPKREILYADDHCPILVLSEKLVKDFNHPNWACISITEMANNDSVVHPSACEVLRLKFDDTDINESGAYSREQAEQVRDFVEFHRGIGTQLLVFQCLAGISRSAGMAGAISAVYNQCDRAVFMNYDPNSRVYRLTLEAFLGPLIEGAEIM